MVKTLPTIAVTPEAIPIAREVIPAPISVTPAPNARAATPSKAMAPARDNITGITGARAIPATQIRANTPAIAARLFTMLLTCIAPMALSTGARIARAAAMISSAAEAFKIPEDRFDNIANPAAIAKIPEIAAPALMSCSQSIPPNFWQISANISIAAAIIVKLTTEAIIFFDKPDSRVKPAARTNIPPIAAPAFTSPPHSIVENFWQTSANISIEDPMIISAIELRAIFFDKPDSRVNPAAMASIPDMAAPAFASSPHSIVENFLHTSANISIATPMIAREVAERIIFAGLILLMRA